MFESKITSDAFEELQDTPQLRAVSWPELVARLTAARDLRRLLVSARSESRGAFTGFAAIRAGLSETMQEGPLGSMINETEVSVNPDGLADGKDNTAIDAVSANAAAHGDREIL